jgi:hypothetical protein
VRRGRHIILAAACALLAAMPASARAQAFEFGHVPACFEAVPAAVAAPTGQPIEVRVHVVLDKGVSIQEGRHAMERARVAYEPMGLQIVPSFSVAEFNSDEADALFGELKARFGGQRPPWAHVVYLLTKRDIAQAGQRAVAGVADCIGGVAFADSAFAIGEAGGEGNGIGPATWFMDDTAKVAAHEIGHLFGAHHHYANCAEGVPDEPTDVSPCTMMFNDIALVSLRFSTLNSAIVRGHAVSYLEPVTAVPPPDGSPTLPAPPPPPCDFRAYTDRGGDHASLVVNNPDDADLLAGSFHTELIGGREVVRFRWKLASLDGEFTPGAKAVRYRLDLSGPRVVRIEAVWDGKNPPTARALEGTETLAELRATVTMGPGGVIEVELPLAQLGLDGDALTLGTMSAPTDFDEILDYDTADPIYPSVEPAACAWSTMPPAVANGGAPVERPGSAPRLRAELVDTSARRASRSRRVRVRLQGAVVGGRVRLVDMRGRVLGSARVGRVAGARVVTLRVKRRLRAGAYELVYSGRNASRAVISGRVTVRLRR